MVWVRTIAFMHRIDHQIKILPYHPSMKAQVTAVNLPLFGPMAHFRKEHPERLTELRTMWRKRVLQLKQEGWNAVQNERIVYICNCPPHACGYEPKTQSCNLRICPFCHARRVSAIYTRIRDLIIQTPGSVRVAAWRRTYGFKTDEDRIFFDDDMGLSTFSENVNPRHRNIRKQFRKEYMADAIGGVYWYTVAPYTYQRQAADGSAGRWNVLHGCVAVMPGNWKHWESNYLRVIKDPDDYQLAWLVGRSFQYRRLWLDSSPSVMATFLNATHRDVYVSAFGKLGPNYRG